MIFTSASRTTSSSCFEMVNVTDPCLAGLGCSVMPSSSPFVDSASPAISPERAEAKRTFDKAIEKFREIAAQADAR